MSIKEKSCTEAWAEIHAENAGQLRDLRLIVNGEDTSQVLLMSNDTTLYIQGLTIGKPNTIKLTGTYLERSTESKVISVERQVITLDTTSSDFTWEIAYFGEKGQSSFKDVSIVENTDIWAVGEVNLHNTGMQDSSGKLIPPINAVWWDGNIWKLKQVWLVWDGNRACYPQDYIMAFGKKSIWFTDNQMWNGDSMVTFIKQGGMLANPTSAWGINENLYYVGGGYGFFAKCTKTTWQQIALPVGDKAYVSDIHGCIVPSANRYKTYVTVLDQINRKERKVLTIDENNKVETLDWAEGEWIRSTWSPNGWLFYIAGDDIWDNCNGKWKKNTDLIYGSLLKIRGTRLNNIVAVGYDGLIMHFNGVRWKSHTEFPQIQYLTAVAITETMIAAVGSTATQAVVVIGRKIR